MIQVTGEMNELYFCKGGRLFSRMDSNSMTNATDTLPNEIEASKTRAQAPAVWIAIEGWKHFAKAGFAPHAITTVAMAGCNAVFNGGPRCGEPSRRFAVADVR